MKRINRLVAGAFVLLMAFTINGRAADIVAVLKVDNMTCMSCPYQVKSALKKVDGVKEVVVSLESKRAKIIFDDRRTNVVSLMMATKNAGYPSTVVKKQEIEVRDGSKALGKAPLAQRETDGR